MLSDLDSDKITACIVCAGVLVFRCQSFLLHYAVAQVLEKRGEK